MPSTSLYFSNEHNIICEYSLSDFFRAFWDCGDWNKGNGTPVGIYGITYKERDATLKGENYSSDVSFWMPFNGNVGMHDATWRSMFGGDIYLTNGSHGCINLPYKKANEIFDNIVRETLIFYQQRIEIDKSNEEKNNEEEIKNKNNKGNVFKKLFKK